MSQSRPPPRSPVPQSHRRPPPVSQRTLYRPPPPPPRSQERGCATGVLLGLLMFLILVLLSLGVILLGYVAVARDLPSPDQLTARSSHFETTRIYDRQGHLLQEPLAPDDAAAGLRRRVSLSEISPYLLQATIATEDANFYSHRGVDPVALGRALFQALRRRGPVVGASTISQQLVKLVFLSPERTVSRKVKEAILAAEITRRYDKDTILEIYLNELNYGHLAYGVEAAARVYFNVSAGELSLAQAALLAGLPQSPATYDPLQNPAAAKARQADVLGLMVRRGYITPEEADAAWLEELGYYSQGLESIRLDEAPHFVMFVRSQIEQRYGPEVLYGGGLQVYTTLDRTLQQQAEAAVQEGIANLQGRQVGNGALVALHPQSGAILAMVGSLDFDNPEIDGQVNVALAPRQPGSAIKPFTYLAAFEREEGWWTPATLIDDVRTEFYDGPGRPPYAPVNYDGKEHGRISVRAALANSYNIPAVKALEYVGVDALLEVADRFGLATLTRPDHPPYGLALTLGGGEVTLLELTGAYATLANGGLRAPPAAVLCVLDAQGRALERLEAPGLPEACREAPLAAGVSPQPPLAQPAASAGRVYLLTDILKDNEARAAAFGRNSALQLGRPAAVKTGTTNDVRDGWAIGYTPELVTGVWVGNSDGSPMDSRLSGSQSAAPIWNRFMGQALATTPPSDFVRPEGVEVVEICTLTGAVPDSACPPDRRRAEVFAAGQLPPGADSARYQVLLTRPSDGDFVQGVVSITGSAVIPDFDYYLVEYGESYSPGAWGLAAGPVSRSIEAGELAAWDVRRLSKDGPHVLRVVAVNRQGVRFESPAVRVRVLRSAPVATATATTLPTPTPTVRMTATPTGSPTATPTLTPSPSPTATSTASFTPTATPTPSPTATPTAAGLIAVLEAPRPGAIVQGMVAIRGQAGGANFASYRLELRQAGGWTPLDPSQPEVFTPRTGVLGQWDSTTAPNDAYVIRLLVSGINGLMQEESANVTVAN